MIKADDPVCDIIPPFFAYYFIQNVPYKMEFRTLDEALGAINTASDVGFISEVCITDSKLNILFHNEGYTPFEAEAEVKSKNWRLK